jgi:MFS family permease
MAMLIAARAIQGIGGGGIVILVNVSISDLFSMRKRGELHHFAPFLQYVALATDPHLPGMYFGFMGMVWAVAGGLGPIMGGAFTDRVSWR